MGAETMTNRPNTVVHTKDEHIEIRFRLHGRLKAEGCSVLVAPKLIHQGFRRLRLVAVLTQEISTSFTHLLVILELPLCMI